MNVNYVRYECMSMVLHTHGRTFAIQDVGRMCWLLDDSSLAVSIDDILALVDVLHVLLSSVSSEPFQLASRIARSLQ